MVAHAALVSLVQIVDSILDPAAGRMRISHNRAQLKTLHQKVSFLLDFLGKNSPHHMKSEDPELDRLETMIRKAAYTAEDVIESDIRDQLCAETNTMLCLVLVGPSVMIFYMLFYHAIGDSIRLFLPVLGFLGTSLQSLLPITFQSLLFVMGRALVPLAVRILEHLSSFVLAADVGVFILLLAPEVSRYWLYAHQPENQDLGRAIDDINIIMDDAIKVKDGRDSGQCRENQTKQCSDVLSRGLGKDVVVGLDSNLNEVVARLFGYPSELEIVTILGMGGIGKTTLARQVYGHPCIVDRFDICAWITVSQDYSLRRVLLGLLDSAKIRAEEILQKHIDDELDCMLGEHLYKNLMSRRYLIVVDDMWETDIWDFVRRFLPDNQNGSRVLLTTRLSEVASYAYSGSPPLQMGFLDDGDSWDLLHEKVFGGMIVPQELEAIGRMIARDCGGLPLAILVVGGLLYNEHRTEGDWMRVSKNLHSIISKDDDQCLEILGLSYNHLPHRLKPCFLYMGAFPEDEEIRATKLFNLWAAEGFLEPSESKTLEEVAEEYLKDLVQRSLIMVGKLSSNGKIKTCKIHDILRDVCMIMAHKENFLEIGNDDGEIDHVGHGWDETLHRESTPLTELFDFANDGDGEIGHGRAKRRLITHVRAFRKRSCCPLTRSFICFGDGSYSLPHFYTGFRLLRVLDIVTNGMYEFPDEIFNLVLLRYLGLTYDYPLSSSISQLWNLQTIVFYNRRYGRGLWIPDEIWSMPNLRHLYFTAYLLPNPPTYHQLLLNSHVLGNLQTLVGISDFQCTKGILKSIPNLKKLGISYDVPSCVDWSEYQLESLAGLDKLESLKITVEYGDSTSVVHPPKLAFPQTLQRLTLNGCRVPWESMRTAGALPDLQVLKLKNFACQGEEWEPVEGEFCRLMFLLIEDVDLVEWRSNDTHFPRLQRLVLRRCSKLQEVPCGLGDIATLERIELVDCHPCAVASAKEILMEQRDMGNEDLKIHIERLKKVIFD